MILTHFLLFCEILKVVRLLILLKQTWNVFFVVKQPFVMTGNSRVILLLSMVMTILHGSFVVLLMLHSYWKFSLLFRNVWMKALSVLPISFEQNVIDEWCWYQNVCLVAPNRMIPNITNVDLTWPGDTKLGGGQILKLTFWAKLGITRFISTRETRTRCIRCSRTKSLNVIAKKAYSLQNSDWPCRKRWPLVAERLTWSHIWDHAPDITFILLPLLFADWSYLS